MVHCPDALVWEIVKKHNSFLKPRNGRTRRSGRIQFSVEKCNLRNLSTYKCSGLANSKAVDVLSTSSPANGAILCKKTASKAHAYPNKTFAIIPINKDYRRVERTIKKLVQDEHYRPDLTRDAMAKYSAVYRGNRAAKGIKKPLPMKKGRN